MTQATTTKSPPSKTEARKPSRGRRCFIPWKHCFVAALPLSLLAYYVAWVAPGLSHNPDPPFPILAEAIENACNWSGAHRAYVAAIAGGLLVPGLILRISAKRYFVFLALLATLTLGITYYSVSAPIERLFQSVKDSIPTDDRTQLYLKK